MVAVQTAKAGPDKLGPDPAPDLSLPGDLGALRRNSRHGRITAVSMMKDEGAYLLEWIAHHLAIGFTDIVVYTNDCSDGTDAMLIRLEELGLAHHRRNIIPPGLRPQPSALNHAQDEPIICASDWVLVFDADEFLCIRHGDGTLDMMLDEVVARDANGVVITWRIFGSGGIQDWSRAPVSEQYLTAAPPDWNKGWGVKTLFKFDPEYWKLGIHRPKMKNRWLESDYPATVKWLNGSGQPMEEYFKFRGWRSITRTIGYDWVQMNHYAVKSIDSYAVRKFRGNVNLKKDKYNADYWSLQDRNERRDETMLRYAPLRGRIFDLLLGDPALNQLHHAALARLEARLAEFKATEAYATLVAGLRAAAGVPLTEVVAKPPQARDRAKIAALMSRVERDIGEKQKAARRATAATNAPTATAVRLPTLVASPDLPPQIDPQQPSVPWHTNHRILLPADPRFFTATALDLISAGKFERSLARSLNRLLAGMGSILDLGAGAGFRAALLARSDHAPGRMITAVESQIARIAMIRAIWRKNGLIADLTAAEDIGDGLAAKARLNLHGATLDGATLTRLLRESRAQALILADPELGPATLGAAIAQSAVVPQRLIITADAMALAEAWQIWARAELGLATSAASSDFVFMRAPRPVPAGLEVQAPSVNQGNKDAE
jgi:16S rRNA G1207 methylase RsmC